MAHKKHPVIIVGGGPAGAAAAMYLLRQGIIPVILERARHPRYHVGESLTGATSLALKDLGLGPKIEAQNYPIKHGAVFYGPDGKNDFWVELVRRNEKFEQVPNYTWNVMRSTFDKILFDGAVERGAIWMEATAIAPLLKDDSVVGLTIRTPEGATDNLYSDVVIDASGISTFLANQRVTGKKVPGRSDKQIGLFTQFANTIRDNGDDRRHQPGNTLLYYQAKHHWGWFIPVSEELTSVGIVVKTDYFKKAGLSKEDFMLRECRQMTPALSERLPDLSPQEPINAIPNFSYRVMNYTGKGFLCVGDAHRFIDPIFAYGVYFGIQEAQFAATAVSKYLAGEIKTNGNPFAEYERLCDEGNDVVEDTIGVLWEYPLAFQRIVTWRDRAAALDVLSGRIYGEEGAKNPARIAMRKLMAAKEKEWAEEASVRAAKSEPELASALG
ncbi:MAG: FAD-dependent monooxygenase [Armatimonadetes bacterium]|nr:FAD-dependent monooxygenase [Armatimonadota bacterium]